MENGQFTDADTNLINRHNTHSESERIQKEYTEHLMDLTDNQYYSEEYPSNQLQYSILDPEYYGPCQGDPTHNHTILQVITLHPQTQLMFNAGTHVEEENVPFYVDIDFLEERPTQQKAGNQGKSNRTLNNKLES